MVSRPAVINAAQKSEKVTVSCNRFFIISEKITCRNTSAIPLNNIKQKRLPNIILNTNKIQEKICAEITYIQDCRLDFFQILNGV